MVSSTYGCCTHLAHCLVHLFIQHLCQTTVHRRDPRAAPSCLLMPTRTNTGTPMGATADLPWRPSVCGSVNGNGVEHQRARCCPDWKGPSVPSCPDLSASAVVTSTSPDIDARARYRVTSWKFKKIKKNRSDITPDPGGHRPQRPCAQGRTSINASGYQ